MIQLDIHLILLKCRKNVENMQINHIFHNCPEQQQQEQQSNPKDLGSKFPRSKITSKSGLKKYKPRVIMVRVPYVL